MNCAIILEDNQDKVKLILARYPELEKAHVFVVRSVSVGEMILNCPIGKYRLYLDYELFPGCGNGKEFLETVLSKFKHDLTEVIVTTGSPDMAKEMAQMCHQASVKVFQYVR